MSDQALQMYKELTETPGAPGHEGRVREVMKKYIEPHADEITYDNLGSLIARKGSEGPKIMVAGHLDEVGFMVTMITEKGFLRFQPLGGWWEQVMLAQRVAIQTRKGVVEGVIGSVPPHILSPEARKKPIEMKNMFIDIGASSKKEAEEFGIRPGDTVIPICPFTVMNNPKIMMAKAWDNRVGIAMAIQTLQQLVGVKHPNTVYGVGTVQEEVGLRGAQTAAHTVNPDIAFAVDVGIAGDTPGVKEEDAQSKIGEGPQILLYDASMVPHVGLRNLVVETAEEQGIPFQYDTMARGGTDAGRMHLNNSGVPSIVIGIATRYIHSHAAILHRDDIDNAVKLITEVIKKLDADTVEKLKRG
ncbi:endoglucanase [Aneurinibacillus soli]|uniref:Putative aminopeptidase YsdC n=1 Tax=Aneurinibacillus soli TaxID=1500254 RepID=A0A0U4WDN9_9BACL|nr:endoglucanase [Aneurinibacillus soli]BAU26905.1 putative aminopeptidase YsdC [Aneurinibacillus soli]